MVAAVEKAGVPNMVWYNYRRSSRRDAGQEVSRTTGTLGRIFHYRANFLQDWTISADLPQGGTGLWRLDVEAAGSGVTGDLLAHCIDTAMWINGGIERVTAMTETFVKERKHNLTGKVRTCRALTMPAPSSPDSRTDRWPRSSPLATPAGIRRSTRSRSMARTLRIQWDLHDLHRLSYFDHRDEGGLRGWRSIHVTDGEHPYMNKWWVPGLQIGYEHCFVHQVADFLEGLSIGKPASPTFRDALETQKVCDAVLESGKTERWVDVG